MSAAELFDTHCHLFERGFHGKYGFLARSVGDELASYERFRDEFSITRSLVVGYEEADAYEGNNAYIAGLAQIHDWLVPLRFVTPGGSVARGELLAIYAPDAASGATAAEMLIAAHAADRAPAIVSLNAPPEALETLAPAIRRLTNTWFLVSHLGLPGPLSSAAAARDRLAALTALAGLSHVSVKLSGQYAASAGGYPHEDAQLIVDMIADAFGVGALVWGSDFSPCLEYISFDQAIHCLMPSGASDGERAAILSGNATRMFDNYYGAAR